MFDQFGTWELVSKIKNRNDGSWLDDLRCHAAGTSRKIFSLSDRKIFFVTENRKIFSQIFSYLKTFQSSYKNALRPHTRSFNNKTSAEEIEKFEQLIAENVDIPNESDAPKLLRLSSTKGIYFYNFIQKIISKYTRNINLL